MSRVRYRRIEVQVEVQVAIPPAGSVGTQGDGCPMGHPCPASLEGSPSSRGLGLS